ncbi:MAG TPA: DUF4065 domain-containing protein [Bacteroidales bacterium]|nr:DUF4065 domain-containing protein [Bacteroidales bacterium]
MATIYQISDYVIFRCKSEGNVDLSILKHQKLLYYIQAWHLAFHNVPAFDASFQAWIHGPVNREIYELYKENKYLYSEMSIEDMLDPNVIDKLSSNIKEHVDIILDSYAKYSATDLEIMTHQEEPWIEARKGFKPNERCENDIKNETMTRYYAARLD